MARLIQTCMLVCVLSGVSISDTFASYVPDCDMQRDVILSTSFQETLGKQGCRIEFGPGSLVEYDRPPVDSARLFLDESIFTGDANIDAVHVLGNGHILLSTDDDAELAGLAFRDGDLIDYDWTEEQPKATRLLAEEDLFADGDGDIDAVWTLGDGSYIRSTTDREYVGTTWADPGDLVRFWPSNKTASLLFDGGAGHFAGPPWPQTWTVDIDAASVLENGHIVLSTGHWENIRNGEDWLLIQPSDLVEYDVDSRVAKLFFDHHWLASGTNIDAVYVPEPATALVLGLGALVLVVKRRS